MHNVSAEQLDKTKHKAFYNGPHSFFGSDCIDCMSRVGRSRRASAEALMRKPRRWKNSRGRQIECMRVKRSGGTGCILALNLLSCEISSTNAPTDAIARHQRTPAGKKDECVAEGRTERVGQGRVHEDGKHIQARGEGTGKATRNCISACQ
jgi:hypothetical protein